MLSTALKNENKTLKELVTSSIHLLIKSGVVGQEEFDACDSYKEMTDLFDTKLLVLLKEERV